MKFEILNCARTIAEVGLSDNPERESYCVAQYLLEHRYRLIPVHPNAREILGQKSYACLHDIPETVDIVDIFRKPEAIPEIVDEAIATGTRCVWMQSGLVHNEAAAKVRQAGLLFIMNRCIMVEHRQQQA